MDTTSFENGLRSDGFQEIETKGLPAGMCNKEHEHPFDVRALVLEGQISLTVAGVKKTYGQGEVFTMATGCRHNEEVGAQGVRYITGRRRASAPG